MTEIETTPRRTGRRRAVVIGAVAAGSLAVGGGAWAVSASGIANPSSPGSGGYGYGQGHAGSRGPSSGSGATSCGAGADGYLSAVSSTSLTLKDLFGTAHTYSVTSATTVHSDRTTTIKITALTSGAHVHVQASGTKATEVDLLPAAVDGAVTAAGGSTLTVRDVQGFTRTVVTSGTTTYTKDGAASAASAVATGTVVHAEGTVDGNGTTLDATSVSVRTSATAPIGGLGGGPADHGAGCRPAGSPAGGPAGGPAGAPHRGSDGARTPPSGAPARPGNAAPSPSTTS